MVTGGEVVSSNPSAAHKILQKNILMFEMTEYKLEKGALV